MIQTFAEAFGAPLDETYLRLEYAQDIDGFWLQPHTDLGVKKFTCLIYLSQGPGHELLGTDIYASPEEHVGASPFHPQFGDDLRAGLEHLARLREAADPGCAPLGDPELRHARMARPRAAVLPGQAHSGVRAGARQEVRRPTFDGSN